jgi:CDP-glycerol glycerophosphotransferase
MPELLEVLRFQRQDHDATAPLQIDGRFYGDFPFWDDERLGIPREVFRLDQELTFQGTIESVCVDGGVLRVEGYAYVDWLGAGEPGAQTVSAAFLRPDGRLKAVRLRTLAVKGRVREVHRPELDGRLGQLFGSLAWGGFVAEFPVGRLAREGLQELYVTVHARRLRRRGRVFAYDEQRLPVAAELPAGDELHVRARPGEEGEFAVAGSRRWAAARGARLEGDALVLDVELGGLPGEGLALELREAEGRRRKRFPLGQGVSLAELAALVREGARKVTDSTRQYRGLEPWITGAGRPVRVTTRRIVPDRHLGALADGRELVLRRTQTGDAALVIRHPRVDLAGARWDDAGRLQVDLERLPEGYELVLFARDRLTQHPMEGSAFTPAAIPSLDGPLPLPFGRWFLCARPVGAADPEALLSLNVTAQLNDELPLAANVDGKDFTLQATRDGDALLVVDRDLAWEERGPYNQERLHGGAYLARRSDPLEDTVVYASFRGRQYSDSPRAIHEELVRRGAPLEHLWVVRDGACRVPGTARRLREGSREHYEAMARARYVVSNDHFPEWFERRRDQICVQTWHGTPLKKLGFDVSLVRGATRDFEIGWDVGKRNWQYVVSPNRFSTPILQRAYVLERSEMLETGYPRVDVLAGGRREELGRALRERLGIPADARTVLYAPTFRDQFKDQRNRYRMQFQLDVERLRAALGPDWVILFRKHHYVVDQVPATADGFVRDVSTFPDGTELMLAADVLVTDYSSMIVDYANTGRPILLYTYDLDDYREEIRGFYVDFEATVPGPLLRTSDEVAEALLDLDGVRSAYAQRYAAFAERFCELDDGRAAARVVDRIFSDALPPGGGR